MLTVLVVVVVNIDYAPVKYYHADLIILPVNYRDGCVLDKIIKAQIDEISARYKCESLMKS